MMNFQLNEINHRIRTDVKGFLAECDAGYQAQIDSAAESIISRLDRSPIVLLSGPSGSGKTTSAMKIEQALEARGVETHNISMDNYFRTVNPKTAPPHPGGRHRLRVPSVHGHGAAG